MADRQSPPNAGGAARGWWTAGVLMLIAVLAGLASPASAEGRTGTAGEFDYYILALSWSPTFCASDDANAARSRQCRDDYGFIVHGLWPQYTRGWPQYCPTSHPLRLDASLLDAYRRMTPDRGLLAHQWRKHGVCAGLSPDDYFATAAALRSKLIVPEFLRRPTREISRSGVEIAEAFVADNAGLQTDMLIVACDGRRLDEVRICFARDGAFRACSGDVRRRSCERRSLLVLPVIGNR